MSNELFNAHIAMGSPCGDDADMDQIANWAGCVILGDMTEFNEMKAAKEKAEALLIKAAEWRTGVQGEIKKYLAEVTR